MRTCAGCSRFIEGWKFCGAPLPMWVHGGHADGSRFRTVEADSDATRCTTFTPKPKPTCGDCAFWEREDQVRHEGEMRWYGKCGAPTPPWASGFYPGEWATFPAECPMFRARP